MDSYTAYYIVRAILWIAFILVIGWVIVEARNDMRK
jgi:hypothetical protein